MAVDDGEENEEEEEEEEEEAAVDEEEEEEEEEEEKEEEEALQKITKEDHATCQAHFLPNHGKNCVRSAPLPPSHRCARGNFAALCKPCTCAA